MELQSSLGWKAPWSPSGYNLLSLWFSKSPLFTHTGFLDFLTSSFLGFNNPESGGDDPWTANQISCTPPLSRALSQGTRPEKAKLCSQVQDCKLVVSLLIAQSIVNFTNSWPLKLSLSFTFPTSHTSTRQGPAQHLSSLHPYYLEKEALIILLHVLIMAIYKTVNQVIFKSFPYDY